MRDREEFKTLIEQKREKYYAMRAKRKKQLLAAVIPVAACVVLCCVLLSAPVSRLFSGIKETVEPENAPVSVESQTDVLSVDVFPLPFPEWEQNGLQRRLHYTNPQKMNELLSYFSQLTLSDSPESAENDPGGTGYQVIVTYRNGTTLTYVHSRNQYLRINDGAWKGMQYEEAVQLEELLKRLPSD